MDLNDRIAQIDLKVRQLALKLDHLRERNTKLTNENKELKLKLENAVILIADMEEKMEMTEAALERKQSDDPKDVQDLRKKVDSSIKEVDKVIDWLEKN